MSVINNLVPQRNFELIRDRIGEIIADEMANQNTLVGDDSLLIDTYIERIIPLNNTELPAVNVLFDNGNYDSKTSISMNGGYLYNIDVYTKGISIDGQRGDNLANIKLQRFLGIISAIFSSPKYLTLGFVKPLIERSYVESIRISEPTVNNDNSNITMGRITMRVMCPESLEQFEAILAVGYDTTVKLSETDKGYKFTTNN